MKRKGLEAVFSVRKDFPGDGTPKNNDGLEAKCRLFQPSAIFSEFNKVLYLCDSQRRCIKMLTPLKKTAEFGLKIRILRIFFSAYSNHEKHQAYDSCDLSGAIFRVSSAYRF